MKNPLVFSEVLSPAVGQRGRSVWHSPIGAEFVSMEVVLLVPRELILWVRSGFALGSAVLAGMVCSPEACMVLGMAPVHIYGVDWYRAV